MADKFDVKEVLEDLEKKTFKGVYHDTQFYPRESEATYLKLEYSPDKLVKKQKSMLVQQEYVGELSLEHGLPVSLEEYLDGKKLKSYDAVELADLARLGVLQSLFMEHDPRAWLSVIEANEVKGSKGEDGSMSFQMNAKDALFGTKIIREVVFSYTDKLDKMVIKESFNGRDKAQEIVFSYD